MATTKEQGWEDFLRLCSKTKSTAQLDELFELFLTSEERNALGLRIALISELLKGEKTQREISADLEISIAKITRGSNALKIIPDSLRKFLEKYLVYTQHG